MNVSELYRYSIFADLAYVEWSSADSIQAPPNATQVKYLIEAAHKAKRVPGNADTPTIESLGDRAFSHLPMATRSHSRKFMKILRDAQGYLTRSEME